MLSAGTETLLVNPKVEFRVVLRLFAFGPFEECLELAFVLLVLAAEAGAVVEAKEVEGRGIGGAPVSPKTARFFIYGVAYSLRRQTQPGDATPQLLEVRES